MCYSVGMNTNYYTEYTPEGVANIIETPRIKSRVQSGWECVKGFLPLVIFAGIITFVAVMGCRERRMNAIEQQQKIESFHKVLAGADGILYEETDKFLSLHKTLYREGGKIQYSESGTTQTQYQINTNIAHVNEPVDILSPATFTRNGRGVVSWRHDYSGILMGCREDGRYLIHVGGNEFRWAGDDISPIQYR